MSMKINSKNLSRMKTVYNGFPSFKGWVFKNVWQSVQAQLDVEGDILDNHEAVGVILNLMYVGAMTQDENGLVSKVDGFESWPEDTPAKDGTVCPHCGYVVTDTVPGYLPVEGIYQRVVDAINALPEGGYFFSEVCAQLKESMPDEKPLARRNAVLGVYRSNKYRGQFTTSEAMGTDGKLHKTWGPK